MKHFRKRYDETVDGSWLKMFQELAVLEGKGKGLVSFHAEGHVGITYCYGWIPGFRVRSTRDKKKKRLN